MSEVKRQIGIKTRSVKRLAADLKSYLSERTGHALKLDGLQSSSSSEAHELKRAREFVEEADATVADVRQRLQEAYQVLERYLEEVEQQGDAEVLADQCFVDARKMLDDTAGLVTIAADEHKERGFKVSVFGSSQLDDHPDVWTHAEQLGEQLARGGFHVMSGGYTGMSEAVSFGASRVPDAVVEGVTCPSSFAHTVPNQYLRAEKPAADVLDRTAHLLRGVDAAVVLPGSLGTLTKFLTCWHLAVVDSLGSKPPSTLLLVWRQPWQDVIQHLSTALHISQHLQQMIVYVDTVEQVMTELEKMKQHKRSSKLGVHGSHAAAASSSSSSSSSASKAL